MSAIGLCAPIKPGKSDDMRTFAKEVGARMEEFAKARGSLPGNLTRESVWLMPTPMGDFLVAVLEGDDPVASNKALAESKEPLDVIEYCKQWGPAVVLSDGSVRPSCRRCSGSC